MPGRLLAENPPPCETSPIPHVFLSSPIRFFSAASTAFGTVSIVWVAERGEAIFVLIMSTVFLGEEEGNKADLRLSRFLGEDAPWRRY